jgi:hypothetical protein
VSEWVYRRRLAGRVAGMYIGLGTILVIIIIILLIRAI